MAPELLDIQPRELKFTFEVKKQSSCTIQLRNISDQYVAFKVKTTCPKKYCVRPNLGVIQPRETCDFTVIMQAPRAASSDLHCKDKFLIQNTVVPFGTVEDDLTPETFARDGSKHVEDKKLRVVLVSAPSSPVLHPFSGEINPMPIDETSEQKERLPSGVENLPSSAKVREHAEGHQTVNNVRKFGTYKVIDKSRAVKHAVRLGNAKDRDASTAKEDVEKSRAANNLDMFENAKADAFKAVTDVDKSRAANHVDMFENAKADAFKAVIDGLSVAKDMDDLGAKNMHLGSSENVEEVKPRLDNEKSKLAEEFKALKSKHGFMETKLREAELTMKKLIEESSTTDQEKDKLKHELETMRKGKMKTVHVGFPFLYVCMVALVSVVVGYLIHS